jgi:FixJ family two-component response regulator
MPNTEARVFVIDDDPQMLDSLEVLVRSAGLSVSVYDSAEIFLAEYTPDQKRPECVVVDLCMRGMNGLGLQKSLKELGVRVPVILISAFGDVPAVAEAFRGGAFDFLEKPFSRAKLLEAISQALDAQSRHLESHRTVGELKCQLTALSAREREVLDSLIAGKSAKQISRELAIGAKTVSKHRASIFAKLHVESVAELVHLAYMLGLTEKA